MKVPGATEQQQALIDAFLEGGAVPEHGLGPSQIDALVGRKLSELGEGEWLTAREASARTGLHLETASRSLSRLLQNGAAEANKHRPRGYRWVPFVVDLPAGFARERPVGKSWKEHIVTPERYPDGVGVILFLQDGTMRVGDAGNALFRMEAIGEVDPAVREILARAARAGGLGWDGKELFVDPVTPEGLQRLARASADAVWEWRRRRSG